MYKTLNFLTVLPQFGTKTVHLRGSYTMAQRVKTHWMATQHMSVKIILNELAKNCKNSCLERLFWTNLGTNLGEIHRCVDPWS